MSDTGDPLKAEIKQAIVRSLRLPIAPEEIGDATPLFADGLGLDSIDVLELVLEIERSFGVAITDEETGVRVDPWTVGRALRRLGLTRKKEAVARHRAGRGRGRPSPGGLAARDRGDRAGAPGVPR